jgi:hypothetical protein
MNQTKIQKLLELRNINQSKLISQIYEKTGHQYDRGYISKICSGKIDNFTIKTAIIISTILRVKIDKIVELDFDKIVNEK